MRFDRFSRGAPHSLPLSSDEPVHVTLNALAYPAAEVAEVIAYAQRLRHFLAQITEIGLDATDDVFDLFRDFLGRERQSKLAVLASSGTPENDPTAGFDLKRCFTVADCRREQTVFVHVQRVAKFQLVNRNVFRL